MIKLYITYSIFILLILSFFSCAGTRHLPEDEYLARNGEVEIITKKKSREFSNIHLNLIQLAEVNQNNKFLWMRFRLSIYNTIKEPKKEKGFRNWMKNKLGKSPVLYNQGQTEQIKLAMEQYLFNNSFFHADISYSIRERKYERKAIYHVKYGNSYKIDSVSYLATEKTIDEEIINALKINKNNFEGGFYSLNNLLAVRKTLAFSLMNKGYYYFRPNYFEFIADTLNTKHAVNISLNIKSNTPVEAFNQYRINQVYIEDNFNYNTKYIADTQLIQGLNYLTPKEYIKPKVVVNAIHLRPDSLYNRDVHLKTLNHLRSLNVYKFVNILYKQDDSISDRLNARLILEPLSKMSFSGEFNANSKSNNFAGPGVMFSFTNRNSFKGAEVLSLNFGGRFETQIGQSFQGNTSYEIRTDASLRLPRLYPFKSRIIRSKNIPGTVINFGSALQERINWYQMVNWNTALRYNWKSSDKISHRYSPLDINLSSLLKTSKEFNDYLESNPSVQRSFEEQFIIGMNYDYYYSKSPDRLNTPFFFGFTLDLSGNFISGINKAVGNKKPTGEVYKILNTAYSQYVRTVIDIRKSVNLWSGSSFASRVIVAGGYPYGNSVVMPYIKQFYVGGANSLRGFVSRSVGPGTYKYESEENIYIDQAADLKVEMNIEYRFTIWKSLQSAIFTDVGNIWLVNEDENRVGGKFEFNTFLNELAVSSGAGLRYEITPVIIRFDWAWPMRYPYKVRNNNWVVDKIEFVNNYWRKENIILNISLGYPF